MRSLEISNFLHFCPLVRPYSIYMCPFQRTFVSVSYPVLSQRKFHDIHEFSNKKSGSEKRQKQLYKYTYTKKNKNKKKVQGFLIKKHFYSVD